MDSLVRVYTTAACDSNIRTQGKPSKAMESHHCVLTQRPLQAHHLPNAWVHTRAYLPRPAGEKSQRAFVFLEQGLRSQ